jgi:hypothetical protein
MEMDIFGHHALYCESGKGRINRHDSFARVFLDMLHAAGYDKAKPEPRHGWHDKTRPADVYLPAGTDLSKDGLAICFDVGVTARALSGIPKAIEVYYTEKITTHEAHVETKGECYWPLVSSAFGTWENSLRRLIGNLAERISQRTFATRGETLHFWHLRLQVALQRGNAVALQHHIAQRRVSPSRH